MRMRAVLTALILLVGAAGAPAATLQERMAICFSCHGEGGQSPNFETPSIGGQPSPYVLIQLYLFRERQRVVDAMNQVTKGLTDGDLQAFADAISKLPPPRPTTEPGDPQRLERARALVQKYRCGFCHQQNFSGQGNVPRIAAQREDYLLKALRDYKSSARPGYEPTMVEALQPVSDADIVDLAHFLARVQ
jgi:cytochrome c553